MPALALLAKAAVGEDDEGPLRDRARRPRDEELAVALRSGASCIVAEAVRCAAFETPAAVSGRLCVASHKRRPRSMRYSWTSSGTRGLSASPLALRIGNSSVAEGCERRIPSFFLSRVMLRYLTIGAVCSFMCIAACTRWMKAKLYLDVSWATKKSSTCMWISAFSVPLREKAYTARSMESSLAPAFSKIRFE